MSTLRALRASHDARLRCCWSVVVSVRHPVLFLGCARRLLADPSPVVRAALAESIADAVIIAGSTARCTAIADDLLEVLSGDVAPAVREAAGCSMRLIR